jgi:octaprenyl-diphosphate synthase
MAQPLVTKNTSSPSPSGGPVEALHAWCELDMQRVDTAILGHLSTMEVPLIQEMATYLIQSGGKRLRPLLTVACAKLCGYEGMRHVHLATSVEFIHTATLLHDDVIDEASERRGSASSNILWGNQASILVGDFLFSRAFELMVADGSLSVLKTLSKAASEIAEGEVLQLTALGDMDITEELYFRIIQSKTAALFRAACGIGGLVADQDPTVVKALESYGENLGIAFQLVDDLLDYEGTVMGDDLREGNVTLPLMLLHKRATDLEKQALQRALDEADFLAVKRLLSRYSIQQQVRRRAEWYIEKAIQSLKPLEIAYGNQINLLKDVANFCIARTA